MESRDGFIRGVLPVLVASFLCQMIGRAETINVFRSGNELVVQFERFDLLRQANPGLKGVLTLRQGGKATEIAVDLADPAVRGTLVLDLRGVGNCEALRVAVVDEGGGRVVEREVSPIPDVKVPGRFPVSAAGPFAFVEAGTSLSSGPEGRSPKIQLPDPQALRAVRIPRPERSVSKQAITYPVVTEGEAPLRGGVILGRQTAAPADSTRASLYLSYKKAIYEGGELNRWQKFLVEVPIQSVWGKGSGDETVDLGTGIEVHLTNELREPDWQGIRRSILGDDDSNLGQTAAASDEAGRLYWLAGNGLVRFDPATKRFERAPGDVLNLQKLCPGGDTMKGSPGWLTGSVHFVCTRGRVFLIDIGDYLTGPTGSDTPSRRVGGVFSVSQDWTDAAAFAADIRLHAGSWETASPSLYKTPPPVGADVRKLGHPIVTEAGLLITTAGGKYAEAGGPWRLDLDEQGHTTAFGEVNGLADTISRDGGTRFSPTREATAQGISLTALPHVGMIWGRHLVGTTRPGELSVPRASIRQLLRSDDWHDSLLLPKASKHAYRTYAGAPEGVVTVRYDVVGKIKGHPGATGALADSLVGGASLGPCYLLTPVPGEAGQALAICEYAVYPLSKLDFSHLEDRNVVRKTFVPPHAALPVGLGPYDSIWHRQGSEQWLILTGYTGMTRIRYSQDGKVLASMTSDPFHARMSPRPVDGHARGGLKQYDRIFPIFGGRLMNSGTGRSGRGGTAFTTGLELFDPASLGPDSSSGPVASQTAAHLSRCCGALGTLQSRMVWNAQDGSRRQEIFASGKPSGVFVKELEAKDKEFVPANLDEKVFRYEVTEPGELRDLYGFSLPLSQDGRSLGSFLALSPCHRFLVILLSDGSLYTYEIAGERFVDGMAMKTPDGGAVEPVGFRRPGETILTSPDGQLFFLAAPEESDGTTAQFNRIVVNPNGALEVEPYLGIDCASPADWSDLPNSVRCFLPDTVKRDGSVDFIVGWDSKDRTEAKPFVRVFSDFIPPVAQITSAIGFPPSTRGTGRPE